MKGSFTLFLGAALFAAVGPVRAGLLDSPAPGFPNNVPGKVVYRLGPVHYGDNVDTVVQCTNLADQPARLALEIFDDDDVQRGIARAVLKPNASATFATSAGPRIPGAVVVSQLPPVDHGKARVSATTAHLSCTAMHYVRADDGETKQIPVELLKKVAQDD